MSDMIHLVVILSYRVAFCRVSGKGLWRGGPVGLRWCRCAITSLVCVGGYVVRDGV